MLRNLFLVCFSVIVSMGYACGSNYAVIYSRAVKQDGTSFTAFFVHPGPESMTWEATPFNDSQAFKMVNGTDYLPAILDSVRGYNVEKYYSPPEGETRTTLYYVDRYYQLPFGWYINSETFQKVDATELDSLIYLAEKMPPLLRINADIHLISSKQVAMLREGFCNYIYAIGQMSDIVYISTRDSITTQELELYALGNNWEGDLKIKSDRISFFFPTRGNDAWLASLQRLYLRDKKGNKAELVSFLEDTRGVIRFIDTLIDRNLAMPGDFKGRLHTEIDSTIANIDLLVSYLQHPDLHSREAKGIYKTLVQRVKADKRPIPLGDSFWNIYARLVLPQFSHCYERSFASDEEESTLNKAFEDLGIVVLEGLL